MIDQSGKVWICTTAGTPGTWTVSGGSGAPTGAAGGDLGGTYPNPTVPALATKADLVGGHVPVAQLASGTPTGSKFLRDDGTLAIPPNGAGTLGYIDVTAAPYSAVGNGKRVQDAAITSGSAALSSTAAAFTSGDVGKAVGVNNAGTPVVITDVATVGTPTTATTGGTLAAATYYYKVTAVNAFGETLASTEKSIATSGSTSTVSLRWSAVRGAASYRIYRGTSAGAENVYLTSTATQFTDTGAAGTAGTVPGAGTLALPTNLQATISSVSAGVATLSTTAGNTVSSETAVYGTDNTTAIQLALNATVALGGGDLFFPLGVYVIAGALQTTAPSGGGLYRSQLCLPMISTTTNPSQTMGIGMFGQSRTYASSYDVLAFPAGKPRSSMIVSTSDGGAYGSNAQGLPSIIGGPSYAADYTGFTNVEFSIRDMTIIAPANPRLTALNLRFCEAANVERTVVTINRKYHDNIEPCFPTGQGIFMPAAGNNVALKCEASVNGYFAGIAAGEHTLFGNVFVGRCKVAISLPFMYHGVSGPLLNIQNCAYFFAYADPSLDAVQVASRCTVNFPLVTLEDSDITFAPGPHWGNRGDQTGLSVVHINDPSGFIIGQIGYRYINFNETQYSALWTVKGAGTVRHFDVRERKNIVGESGGVPFKNSWAHGSNYGQAHFWKGVDGMIHLGGSITAGAAGSIAFTLPQEMWPPSNQYHHFPGGTTAPAATVGVFITPTGDVTVRQTGVSTDVSLAGINYRPGSYDTVPV